MFRNKQPSPEPQQPSTSTKRMMFTSASKISLSHKASNALLSPGSNGSAEKGGTFGRTRVGSEASSQFYQAAGAGPSTPNRLGSEMSEFGRAWGISSGVYSSRDGGFGDGDSREGKKSLRDIGKDFGRLLKRKTSRMTIGKGEGSDGA